MNDHCTDKIEQLVMLVEELRSQVVRLERENSALQDRCTQYAIKAAKLRAELYEMKQQYDLCVEMNQSLKEENQSAIFEMLSMGK